LGVRLPYRPRLLGHTRTRLRNTLSPGLPKKIFQIDVLKMIRKKFQKNNPD
jgi:hypothetical protein